MVLDFSNTINFLKEAHFYDVVLPFLLVYAITYGILLKSRIFKQKQDLEKNERSIYSIISFVIGLLAVGSVQTVIYINSLIINMVVFLVFILTLLIVLGFVFGDEWFNFIYKNGKKDDGFNKYVVIPVGLTILIVVIILGLYALNALQPLINFFDGLANNGFLTNLVIIILVIGILYFITNGGNSNEKSSKNNK